MKQILILIFGLFLHSLASQATLQKILDEVSRQPFYKHATLGVSVKEIVDSKTIASISKDKMMIPASTLKLITTFTARKQFGASFRFETTLSYDGFISSDGTLHGNIYLKGSGDPTLGGGRIPENPDLKGWETKIVNAIRSVGILCIEGDIIALTRSEYNPPLSDSWQWHDLGNYYATGSWSLNVNENLYNIYYHRNQPLKEKAVISFIEPYIPFLNIQSNIYIDSSHTEDKAFIYGVPFTYQRLVQGSIPQGKTLFKVKGAIPDPPLFLAYRLYNALGQAHISGSQYKTQNESTLLDTKLITTHLSPTLSKIIEYANENSINLYTDALLELIGKSPNPKENGKILKSLLKSDGFDITPIHIEDGSGLSARNLVSADFMAEFLCKQSTFLPMSEIQQLLPRVGMKGTVKNILLKSPAKGNMWIKSGSMDKVLCYAGYCKSASGKLIAFSVMLNGSTASMMKENKNELEKILDAIYRFS